MTDAVDAGTILLSSQGCNQLEGSLTGLARVFNRNHSSIPSLMRHGLLWSVINGVVQPQLIFDALSGTAG